MADEIADLRQQVEELRAQLAQTSSQGGGYYDSPLVRQDWFNQRHIPENGLGREAVKLMVENAHALDFDHRLNTSSYVNVALEQEEEAIALLGLRVNLADQTVYPQSYKLHDTTVNMIANLWHCPRNSDFDDYGVFPGPVPSALPRPACLPGWL